MNISLKLKSKELYVEPSLLFAYPSAVADLYTPRAERVYLPDYTLPSYDLEIKVETGWSDLAKDNMSSKRKLLQKITGFTQNQDEGLDLSGKLIFDTRFDTDRNIAHVLDMASGLLLARKHLSNHFGTPVDVYAICSEQSSNLSRGVFSTLGIPTILTNQKVYGDILNSQDLRWSMYKFHDFVADVLNFQFQDYTTDTPERVFVPRRGSRSLINNQEVVDFLEKRGFKTVYMEDLSIGEEFSVGRNAKVAVVVHGAAWFNFHFNRLGLETPDQPGSGIKKIDVFSPAFTLVGEDSGARPFAAAVNGKWCAVRGQITPRILRELDFKGRQGKLSPLVRPVSEPFRVDIKTIEMALDYLGVD